MPPQITRPELQRIRASRQCLDDAGRADSASAIIKRLFALQAQEWRSAQLAIAARTQGLTQTQVCHEREADRAFVLTWALRGTLHLVAAEDLRWLLKLVGPSAIRATARRYQQLGLSEDIRKRALLEIQAVLAKWGALTRSELAERLARRGIPVAGQAIHHLARFAALRGLICLGPERDGDLTYVLLDDWLPPAPDARAPQDPAAELARRYLQACAPASLADFARWSGLKAAQARGAWAALSDDCVAVSTAEGEALLPREQADPLAEPVETPAVRLLPRYDSYLLGYASRSSMVADAYAKRLHPGGGLIRACLLADGAARGNWKLEKRRRGIRVAVEPFQRLDPSLLPCLEAEVAALGSFLNADAELRVAGGLPSHRV